MEEITIPCPRYQFRFYGKKKVNQKILAYLIEKPHNNLLRGLVVFLFCFCKQGNEHYACQERTCYYPSDIQFDIEDIEDSED